MSARAARRDFTRAIAGGELDEYREYLDGAYASVADAAVCSDCGEAPLHYRGFRRHRPADFRHFYICPRCGREEEV